MAWAWICVIAIAILSDPGVNGFEKKKHPFPHFIMGRPFHGLNPAPTLRPDEAEMLEVAHFTQSVDHFNYSDERVWNQTVYVNKHPFHSDSGPIFVVLGGESFDVAAWILKDDSPLYCLAVKYHAAIYALEHRYYGASRPFEKLTKENLKYLNTRQAAADANMFVRYIQKFVDDPTITRLWLVFGGSYGGMVSRLFHNQYGILTMGTIASSAPLEGVLDFHEYFDSLGEQFRDDPTQSALKDKCWLAMKKAFDTMTQMVWDPQGRKTLSDVFKLKPRLDNRRIGYKDIQLFFAAILANFQGLAQYRNVNVEPYLSQKLTLESACSLLEGEQGDIVERVAAIHKNMTEFYTGAAFQETNVDYGGFVKYLQNEEYDESRQNAAARAWLWQQCNEFGFLTTTSGGKTPFDSILPTNFFIDLCADVFGPEYTIERISESIRQYNEFANSYNTPRAWASVSGTSDPWLPAQSAERDNVFLASGWGHCGNMYPPTAGESDSMTKAREFIEQKVDEFLNATIWKQKQIADQKPKGKQRKELLSEKELQQTGTKVVQSSSGLPALLVGMLIQGLQPSNRNSEEVEMLAGIQKLSFQQKLDHSDSSNSEVFDQRFWMLTDYYKTGGPIFLLIGAEAAVSDVWLQDNYPIVKTAQKLKAAVYLLEHRFYGESRPKKSETHDLMKKVLNVGQALADIANFIQSMNTKYNYANPQWITFGGAYAGALSAWFRQKYPELTVGAIASSAPIEVKVDFYEYIIEVEKSIKQYSAACYDSLHDGFEQMLQNVMTPEGRIELSQIFSLQPAWDASSIVADKDIQYFFHNVFSYFEYAVQYDRVNLIAGNAGGGIKAFCDIMTDTTVPSTIQRIADAYKALSTYYTGKFEHINNSYQNYVTFLQNENYADDLSTRSWLFQVCHELGYFQSTDIGNNFLDSSRPVNYFINLCLDVFNDFEDEDSLIYSAVQKTQQTYGGKEQYNGTNVVFINGKMDPWHVLGKLNTTDSAFAVFLDGTAHCADMYPPRSDDPAELVYARSAIEQIIETWMTAPTTAPIYTPNCPSQNTFESDQTVSSPGYPFTYDINTNCIYYFKLSSGSKLHLHFRVAELNIGDDDFIDFIDLRYGTVFASTESDVSEGTELNAAFSVGINFRSGSVSELFGRWRIQGNYVS